MSRFMGGGRTKQHQRNTFRTLLTLFNSIRNVFFHSEQPLQCKYPVIIKKYCLSIVGWPSVRWEGARRGSNAFVSQSQACIKVSQCYRIHLCRFSMSYSLQLQQARPTKYLLKVSYPIKATVLQRQILCMQNYYATSVAPTEHVAPHFVECVFKMY